MFMTPSDDTNSMRSEWWFKIKFEYETGESDKKGRTKTKKEYILVQGDSAEHVTRIALATMTTEGFQGVRITGVTQTNILEVVGNAMIASSIVPKQADLMSSIEKVDKVKGF